VLDSLADPRRHTALRTLSARNHAARLVRSAEDRDKELEASQRRLSGA
jgi:hypothetical protein